MNPQNYYAKVLTIDSYKQISILSLSIFLFLVQSSSAIESGVASLEKKKPIIHDSCASTIRYESTTRQHQQQREQQPPSLEGQIEFKRNSHNVFGKNVFALQHTCHIAIALDRQRKTTYPIPNIVHKHIAVRSFVGTSRNYHLTCVLRQTRFVIGAILFVLRLLL